MLPHDQLDAMVTWVGAALQGIDLTPDQADRSRWADTLLGEGAMDGIRAHFADQPPDQPERERVGAILACIWVAQADRVVTQEEREMLVLVVENAGVAPWRRAELLDAIDTPVDLAAITTELTHPALRELVIALGWRLAASDDDIAEEERVAMATLAEALEVSSERVTAIRAALDV
ncbi:MAG: DUF533 domain-containing protein [Sandaracinaceae bacterium]